MSPRWNSISNHNGIWSLKAIFFHIFPSKISNPHYRERQKLQRLTFASGTVELQNKPAYHSNHCLVYLLFMLHIQCHLVCSFCIKIAVLSNFASMSSQSTEDTIHKFLSLSLSLTTGQPRRYSPAGSCSVQ